MISGSSPRARAWCCRAGPYHAKQLALQAAMEITKRPILANEIRV